MPTFKIAQPVPLPIEQQPTELTLRESQTIPGSIELIARKNEISQIIARVTGDGNLSLYRLDHDKARDLNINVHGATDAITVIHP